MEKPSGKPLARLEIWSPSGDRRFEPKKKSGNPAHGATPFFYIAEDKDFAKLVQKKKGTLGFLKFDDNGMHITLPKAPISSATTTQQGNHVGETLFPFPAQATQKRKE